MNIDHLSDEARGLWEKINAEYVLDTAVQSILLTGLEAHDRMRQAQAIVARDGLVQVDRFGQSKPHPAVAIERDARAAWRQHIKDMGLDLEPLHDGPGRPANS